MDRNSRYIRLPKTTIKEYQKNIILNNLISCSAGYRQGNNEYHKNVLRKNHDEYFINYCIEGEGWLETKDKRIRIQAGELFLCPAYIPYRYGTGVNNPWKAYWSNFIGDYACEYYDLIDEKSKPVVIQTGYQIELINLFEELINIMLKGFSANHHILHASVCLQHIISQGVLLNNKSETGKAKYVNQCIRYMQEHIYEFINLKCLATNVHLSKDHIARLFKKEVSYAPLDYFIRLKMQKACELLDLTSMTIKEIGLTLGYKDYYYFSRCFKNKIGMSPEHYRASSNFDTK